MSFDTLSKVIRRVQISTNLLSKELLAGAYHSAFKGRGIEFEEVREYQPGDEMATIDWKVTARLQKPYVKTFREERNLTVMLVVDISASTRYGSHWNTKKQLIAEVAAVLAFSAIYNNDRVGLVLFTDIIEKYIPPRKGSQHVLRLIRELLFFEPQSQGSSMEVALNFLGSLEASSLITFLISDFLTDIPKKQVDIVSRKHDLIAISVTDPSEHTFPQTGLIQLTDLETGASEVIESSTAVRTEFAQKVAEITQQQKAMFEKAGASFLDIRTDGTYVEALRKFFKMRQLQRR